MHQYSAVEGFATDWHLVNAGRYAVGGAGLVMMESTKVARSGCGTVGDTGLWDVQVHRVAGALRGLHQGARRGRRHPARPFRPQGAPDAALGGWHAFKGSEPEIFDWEGWELVAPSAVPHTDKSPTPRGRSPTTRCAIWPSSGARRRPAPRGPASMCSRSTPPTAICIHQFLSPAANMRTDTYGGSETNRMRFAVEVAECVRAVWPAEKPLFMRLSCEDDAGWGPEESVRLSRLLEAKGVDVIDCSSGGMTAGSPMESARAKKYGYQVPYAEKIRREAGVMTMAVGHIVHARPGRGDPAGRPRRPLRARPRDHVQSQLAHGCRPEARCRSRLQAGAAALFLLARQARQVRLRRQALDLDGGDSGSGARRRVSRSPNQRHPGAARKRSARAGTRPGPMHLATCSCVGQDETTPRRSVCRAVHGSRPSSASALRALAAPG